MLEVPLDITLMSFLCTVSPISVAGTGPQEIVSENVITACQYKKWASGPHYLVISYHYSLLMWKAWILELN